MKRRILKLLIIGLTITAMLSTGLCGCNASKPAEAIDLMEKIQSTQSEPSHTPTENVSHSDTDKKITNEVAVSDFAVRLFQQSYEEDKNTLISPISVLCALSMTANGARNETLTQMEEVFGLSVNELNSYLHTYISQLPNDEKYKLSIANSVWFKDVESFAVEPEFLQINKDYYNAGLFKAAFDASTLQEINKWVEEHTDGMIKDILNEIPEEAVMYLVNALAFDAEWQNVYNSYEVGDSIFTKEDGTTQDIELMYSSEFGYLEDDNAKGFLKYYKDRKYAFAALLPNEGISVADYVSSLTGEHLNDMLQNPEDVRVDTAIPKFESEYSVEMSDVLKTMGMTDAFDYTVSDFTGIGSSTEGNLVINRVLHKTFISVGEQGTKASAATAVEITAESAMAEPEEIKEVYLDRPFVYMIIDCETNLPIFIGTVTEIEN